MTGKIEATLARMDVTLFRPPAPVANYVPYVLSGKLLFVSGQVCYTPDGSLIAKGKLGADVTLERGVLAARQCAINLLMVARLALGELDAIARVIRLGGFVNSDPGFEQGPTVLNGASDLMVATFGEAGRHARTTVGVAALPGAAAVEVEAVFEVR
ncbi:RidA family protein [Xanthobacter sp. KR7-65]|uniref:RidA family protein n=1 Tax=Xanthobacter sp. KR7-65 TaxID=3156612 RepID=UPI0032B3B1FF